MRAVIYHNPNCGTSRNVLRILQASDVDLTVVDYLSEGWSRSQLLGLFAAADLSPRTALRVSKSPAQELGLLSEDVSDTEILDAMLEHPILVNRPIVATRQGTRLCRPSEAVFDLLETLPAGPLYKEDGEMILDEKGNRLG